MNGIYQLGHDFYKAVIETPYVEWCKQVQCHRQISRSSVGETRKRFVGRCTVMIVGWVPIANYVMHLACKFFKATSDDQLHDALNNAQDTLARLYLKSGYTFSKCPDATIAKIFNDNLSKTLTYLQDEAPLSLFESITTLDTLQNAVSPEKEAFLSCALQTYERQKTMPSTDCTWIKPHLFSDGKNYQLDIEHTDISTLIGQALDADCSFSLCSSSAQIDPEKKLHTFEESLQREFTVSRCTKMIAYILKETDLSPEKQITFILQCLEITEQSGQIQEFLQANQDEDAPFIQAIDLLCSQKKWKDLQSFISIASKENNCNLIFQKTIDCICQNLSNKNLFKLNNLVNLISKFPRKQIFNLFTKIFNQNKIDQMPYTWPRRLTKRAPEILDFICQSLLDKKNAKAYDNFLKIISRLPKKTILHLFKKILSQHKIDQIPCNWKECLLKRAPEILDFICQTPLNQENTQAYDNFLKIILQLPKTKILNLFTQALRKNKINQVPPHWQGHLIESAPKILDLFCQNLVDKENKQAHDDFLKIILQLPEKTILHLFTQVLRQNKIDQIPYTSISKMLDQKNVGQDICDMLFANGNVTIYQENVIPALKNKILI